MYYNTKNLCDTYELVKFGRNSNLQLMEILFCSLHHINHEENNVRVIDIESNENEENIKEYVEKLLIEITHSSNNRLFQFERDTLEVRRTVSEFITGNYTHSLENAQRLLSIEKMTQENLRFGSVEIQKGSLFQTLFNYDSSKWFIISKADHDEFLDDEEFKIRKGLPWKKKTFKAALMKINEDNSIPEVKIYDRNNSSYWWSAFLELTPKRNDKHNTSCAFAAMDKLIFNKYKTQFPADITTLRNTAIGYFRSNENMSWDTFVENTFNQYEAEEKHFPLDTIKQKLKDLPEKKDFDHCFPIDRSAITAKMKRQKITIAENVDLILQGEVNLHNFEPRIEGEEKYLMIKSTEGYKHFRKLLDENNRENS